MRTSGLAIASLVLAASSTALADPPPPPPRGAVVLWPVVDPNRPVPMTTHSSALIAGGIVLLGLGTVSIIGGSAAIIDDNKSHGDFDGLQTAIVGIPLLVNALGCIAGGIPMIAVGAKKVPLYPPMVMVTPRSATLRWSF